MVLLFLPVLNASVEVIRKCDSKASIQKAFEPSKTVQIIISIGERMLTTNITVLPAIIKQSVGDISCLLQVVTEGLRNEITRSRNHKANVRFLGYIHMPFDERLDAMVVPQVG